MSMSGISAILYDVSVFETSKILFVTDSGAGPPLDRLYLMPKSFVGPVKNISCALATLLTATYHLGCDWQSREFHQ
jgi:hypothetical protein